MDQEGLMKFKGNPLFSDISLTKAASPDAEPIKAHKVVLAASSGLFFDLFTKENQELVQSFKIPALIPTESAPTEDPYKLVFTYMYSNQSFDKIKDNVSPKNVFQLYSVAYTLRIKRLTDELETFIVNELLARDN